MYDDMTPVTVFCPGNIKVMYQQQDVLMGTVKMQCQRMYMVWNKVLWKKILIIMHIFGTNKNNIATKYIAIYTIEHNRFDIK